MMMMREEEKRDNHLRHTLSVETSSAVSSNVNLLIWSTMPMIFESFEPASVDCHRRDVVLRPYKEAVRSEEGREEMAQARAVHRQRAAILK